VQANAAPDRSGGSERSNSSQLAKPSGGGGTTYPSTSHQNRATRSGSAQSKVTWNCLTDAHRPTNLAAWFARELSRRIMWLAEEGDRPAGMMNLAIFERMPRPGRALSRWGYLGNVFVLAAFRNRGIGSRLVRAALDYADENGFARVMLSPAERSIPFYERAGFGPAGALMLRTLPADQP
jgi:GNAT superfamily N-acetyltransferase